MTAAAVGILLMALTLLLLHVRGTVTNDVIITSSSSSSKLSTLWWRANGAIFFYYYYYHHDSDTNNSDVRVDVEHDTIGVVVDDHHQHQQHHGPSSSSSSSFVVEEQYIGMGVEDIGNLTDFFWLPAAPSGAASRTTLVSVCNPAIEIRTKQQCVNNNNNNNNNCNNNNNSNNNSIVLYRDSLASFFNTSSGLLDSYFWAKVVYDEYYDRFVIAAAYLNLAEPSKQSTIYLAVSKSGSPGRQGRGRVGPDDWYRHAIIDPQPFNATTNEFTFFNNLGLQIGIDAIYVTASRFGSASIDLYNVVLLIVAKDGFYDGRDDGDGFSYSIRNPYDELSSSIPKNIRRQIPLANDLFPAHVYGGPIDNTHDNHNNSSSSNIGTFLISHGGVIHDGNSSYLFLAAVNNPLGSPSLSWNGVVELGEVNQAVLTTGTPPLPDAPQLGSSTKLSMFGTNVFDAVWRSNILWIVMEVVPFDGPNANQTTAYWIKIHTDIVNQKFTLVDHGEIGGEDLGAGTFTFFPSVVVNSQGVAAFGFGASGPSIHPGAYVVGREPNDPNGTASPSFVVKEGMDVFERSLWGYFSSVTVDPKDDTFWVCNAFSDTRFNLTNSSPPGISITGSEVAYAWRTVWRHFRFRNKFPGNRDGAKLDTIPGLDAVA